MTYTTQKLSNGNSNSAKSNLEKIAQSSCGLDQYGSLTPSRYAGAHMIPMSGADASKNYNLRNPSAIQGIVTSYDPASEMPLIKYQMSASLPGISTGYQSPFSGK